MLKTTLEQWRMFKAVVDHGGYSQAAEAIFKSQSSVHHAVRKLEETLETRLLEIDGRKARLTESGRLMLRRASYLLEEAAKVEAIAASLSDTETHLRIAVDVAFPQELLYRTLQEVSRLFPFVCVELEETVLSGAVELLEQEQVDLALTPQPLCHLPTEEIIAVPFIAVAHREHALHRLQRTLEYEDLKNHRQIVTRDSALGLKKDEGWLGSNERWTVSHMRTSIDLVCKGFGFAWLPEPGIRTFLQEGDLAPLSLKTGFTRTVQMHLQYKDHDRLGKVARTFIATLQEEIKNGWQ